MSTTCLTEEQKIEARACQSPEEFIDLVKIAGYDLSDDELESVYAENRWSPTCKTESAS